MISLSSEGDAKPVTDLLANSTAVHAVDLDIVNVMGHENIPKNGAGNGDCPVEYPAPLAARSHQTSFLNQSGSFAVTQAGRGEVRPDLVRAIAIDGPNIEPVSLGQGDCLARFDLRGNTRQHNHRRSQK
jgi:hypothetical protein